MVQFAILLPLFFNDGTPVPVELISRTEDELLEFFGGVSTDTARLRGRWISEALRTRTCCSGSRSTALERRSSEPSSAT